MRGNSKSPQTPAGYREARRAFIAACEKAHVETVARLHPAKSPDGKPLFMDCAAMGSRDAPTAVLVVGYDTVGSDILIGLLSVKLPAGARLVLVHALDPAAFAGLAADPEWPIAMLGAVATEDLSRARHVGVLPLGRSDDRLLPALKTHLSHAKLMDLPQGGTIAKARAEIARFFAAD